MKNLLAELEILDQRWAPLTNLKRVLVIGYRSALSCRQDIAVAFGNLVQLTSLTPFKFLVMNSSGCTHRLSGALGHFGFPNSEM